MSQLATIKLRITYNWLDHIHELVLFDQSVVVYFSTAGDTYYLYFCIVDREAKLCYHLLPVTKIGLHSTDNFA